MLKKRLATILLFLLPVILTGCTTQPVSSNVSELPDSATAKIEAKEALNQWQTLLETGQNAEFVKASMPEEIFEISVTPEGELKPAVLERLRAFAPRIVNALNEAQFLEPYIEDNNVVFAFDEIHNSNGFFKSEKIYLTKSGGHWRFNGEMINDVSK